MPRRSFRPSRRSAPRRKLVWARAFGTVEVLANDSASEPAVPTRSDVLAPFEQSLGASIVGVTVVRTRGVIALSPGAPEFTNVRATLHVGSDAEFAASDLTARDSAFSITGQNLDYFMFEPLLAGASETASNSDVSKRMIDVKSSRKVEELNQTVFLQFSGIIPVAPADPTVITASFDLSLLLMLP